MPILKRYAILNPNEDQIKVLHEMKMDAYLNMFPDEVYKVRRSSSSLKDYEPSIDNYVDPLPEEVLENFKISEIKLDSKENNASKIPINIELLDYNFDSDKRLYYINDMYFESLLEYTNYIKKQDNLLDNTIIIDYYKKIDNLVDVVKITTNKECIFYHFYGPRSFCYYDSSVDKKYGKCFLYKSHKEFILNDYKKPIKIIDLFQTFENYGINLKKDIKSNVLVKR